MRKLLTYFLKRRQKLASVPRQYISEYDVESATPEQLKLMVAGKARTPHEAQRLLDRYETKYAVVVIDLLPVRKKTVWQILFDRLKTLVSRMEGSTTYNPVYRYSKSHSDIEVVYKFRDD